MTADTVAHEMAARLREQCWDYDDTEMPNGADSRDPISCKMLRSAAAILDRQAAEITELRAEVERLRAGGCARDQSTTQYCAEAAALAAEVERLAGELRAATGYLLNAKIDLEAGAPKRTAITTIEGGLRRARAALPPPADSMSGEG